MKVSFTEIIIIALMGANAVLVTLAIISLVLNAQSMCRNEAPIEAPAKINKLV